MHPSIVQQHHDVLAAEHFVIPDATQELLDEVFEDNAVDASFNKLGTDNLVESDGGQETDGVVLSLVVALTDGELLCSSAVLAEDAVTVATGEVQLVEEGGD